MSKLSLINNPTIGADIEVFLQRTDTSQYITAEGIIRGTKAEPHQFRETNKFFATSLDNVMAEFCIPPATDKQEFFDNITEAMNYIRGEVPVNVQVKAVPSAWFSMQQLLSEHAKTFGCDPDYNAWLLGIMNEKPDPKKGMPTLRTAGGHIHIGYQAPKEYVSMGLVRALDIFLGLPSVLQEPENRRKEVYGKAGAFRFKPYGVEYRTLSNYYVNSEVLTKWVFEGVEKAIEFVNEENTIAQEEGDAIQTAINKADKTLAKTMCDYFGIKLAA